MSYLQRLATQTIKAPGNVRPLVNPYVNSTESRPESADEGLAEETIYRNQPKPLPRRTGIPSSPPAFAGGQTSQKVSSAEVSRGLRESSTESIPFEPLTGESEIEGKTSAKDRVVHLEHPLLENSRPQAQAHAESASPGDVPIEIVMQESIEPETRKDPARPRQPPVGKAAHQVRPSDVRILDPHPTRGMEQTHLPRNSGPPLRGADEIEINIGRIEVTAIPPAAPRSTPPARKSLNLDEYLQRRNGRNDR
jgi:hypothetical protein